MELAMLHSDTDRRKYRLEFGGWRMEWLYTHTGKGCCAVGIREPQLPPKRPHDQYSPCYRPRWDWSTRPLEESRRQYDLGTATGAQ